VSRFIAEHRGRFGVEPICRTLGVSASAYYERATGQRSERAVADERLLERIQAVYAANSHAYGDRRPWKALRREGVEVGRGPVKRLLRARLALGGIACDAGLNPRPRSVQMSTPQAVRAAIAALLSALLALLVGAGSASAATDHVVITGGAVVLPGQSAGDVVVIDGPVRIAGHATGNVVSVSGPVRVTGRVDGDLIAVSDRALLAPTARVGGDLRYGDEPPVLARGARVAGKIGKENWADTANGWGWVSGLAWWLAVSVSTLIVGALLVWLAPGALSAAERAVRERLGATIGSGVAIAIGVPLLAILALVTLVGIPFGVALLLAAIPVLLVAYTTTAWIVGRRVLRNRTASAWAALLAGWGILRVLALIPVAGGLVGLAATVVGLGALTVALWRARRSGGPAARPEAPAAGRPAPAA
jgi:HTH-like domain